MPKIYYRRFFIFIILIFTFIIFFKYYKSGLYQKFNTDIVSQKNYSVITSNLRIKQHLLKALRYSRSQNVRDEVLNALSIISATVNIDSEELNQNRVMEVHKKDGLQDVCPEKYLGKIDHPLYNKGQGEYECKKKPFEDVLSFVLMAENCTEQRKLIRGVRKLYKLSQIVIGASNNISCDLVDKNLIVETVKNNAEGTLRLLNRVNTEFVLLAHNIYHFDNQSRIERLVQMVSYTNIDIAAGGARLEDGRYQSGCYQMAMKMYTLKLVHGYDMSSNSCLYCDYSPSPFVTRTSFLVEHLKKLSPSATETGLSMLQLFSHLMNNNRPQILVCPDVLFHVKPYDLSLYTRKEWFPFVSWFSLNRVILEGVNAMDFSCAEAKMTCRKEKGLMVPLCCLKELSDSLKFMNRLLQRQNVTFEVIEGTVMGGLKFNNILFWELDADTNFRVQAIDRLEAKLDEIKKQGYSMQLTYECPHKRDHEKCRHAGWHGSIYYAFRTPNWRTEMYGVTYILSDFRGELKEPTKIKIDDEWYVTYTNPVLYARNIYGGDAFQHVEHSYMFGKTDTFYANVFLGRFSKCPIPGFHGCLSNFAGEGGLQFQDIYI